MSELFFRDYYFDKIEFNLNDSFETDNDSKIKIQNSFEAEIHFLDESNATITIRANLGSQEETSQPFHCKLHMIGLFEYVKKTEDQTFEEYLKNNGIAIMYPYIRNEISNVTLHSNFYPSYIMPTINFVEYLKANDSIKINSKDR